MRTLPGWTLLGLALLLALTACRSNGEKPIALPFELGLDFEGVESVEVERLGVVVRRELERLEVAQADKAAIDDAAFALELFYRARGHAEVRVDYAFEPGEPPRARFRVHEGPVLRVRELVVEGAAEPERVRARLGSMASGGVYDEQRLGDGLAGLRRDYLERGYLRAVVEPPEVELVAEESEALGLDASKKSVVIRLRIQEGPCFRVREVEVRGGAPAMAERERALAREHERALFRPALMPSIEHALVGAYQRAGHPDASVRVHPELDEASGDVRLRVEVSPGERVTIEHFRIVGNARTKDAAVLALMDIEPGTVYDSERVRQAFRELYATGLFESVAIELEGAGSERTLVVTLEELRSVQIRVEPGWGSYEGPRILLGIEERNFQGRGQVLALEGTLSLRAAGARIGWVDRDFLGSDFTSETTFYVEQREEPSYEFTRQGLGFFLRRAWTQKWSSSAGYEFRPTNVTDDSFNTPLPPDLDADSSVAALSTSLTFDTRDNVLAPSRGTLGLGRLEWADDGLGSDTEFVRAQLELVHLFELGTESVLAASARTGVIAPFGETDLIPLPERFFNGGENSVRSYREDELLPPGLDGEPQGGEAATTLNLEYRRILTGNLAAAVFFDTGNVTVDVQDYLRFAGFRSGYGVGLRYVLPIGPVRLDLGVNPDPEDDEDEMVLHFSVGFPF